LINQVLQDLEQRRESVDGPAGVFQGLNTPSSPGTVGNRRMVSYAFVFVLLALGLLILVWAYRSLAPVWVDATVTASEPHALVSQGALPSKPVPERKSNAPSPSPAVPVTEMDAMPAPSVSQGPVAKPPPAPVVVAVKPYTNDAAAKSRPAGHSEKKTVAAAAPQPVNAAVVKTAVGKPKRSQAVTSVPVAAPQADPTGPAYAATEGNLAKRRRPLTAKQQAGVAFREGHGLLLQRRYSEAEAALQTALELDPSHVKAREMLAGSYLRRGDLVAAAEVVRDGMMRVPKHTVFTKLYARILSQQNAIPSAIQVLTRHAPPLAEDLEYHAMLAALYQRQGQYQQAAKTYSELVKLRRNAGVWWMGLGVSLEALGKKPEARLAFDQARESGNLSSQLQRYVEKRLAALGGSVAQAE
jgi:MSHA biogenesis protein MshN